MTGRTKRTPQAEQQLDEVDDRITRAASAEIGQQFVSAILDHSDGIMVFPLAGRRCDEGRSRMRGPGRSGGRPMTRSCVANAWRAEHRRPPVATARRRICAGQRHIANDGRKQPLGVPRFPGCRG
jgi:plasmid stabilization system protein ParE